MPAAPTRPRRGFRAGGRPWHPMLGLALLAWPLAAQAPPKPALQTVGSEICQACHEDVYKAFQGTPHARLDKDARRGWQGKACESCHGPGSAHAESGSAADIRNPAKIAPAESDRMCLGCHLNQPTHVGRIQGGHARGQVACVNCHSIHKPRAETVTSAKAALINHSCASCHVSSWAEFQKPHRHRLPEGAMSCVDCHNPHGSLQRAGMPEVSRRQARTVHFRARLRPCGRLHRLPPAARVGQSAHADASRGAFRLPGMPLQSPGAGRRRRRGASGVSRSAESALPQLHHVPREDPRLLH